MDHCIFTDSSSARQLVVKGGVGKVRHLDGELLWVQNRNDFTMRMAQGATDSNMVDINTNH